MKYKINKFQNQTINNTLKKVLFIGSFTFVLFANTVTAQDLRQAKVPSLVVNSFQKTFPKVYDVEWKLEGEKYKVEFETGLFRTDHDAWFDKTGKLIRHKKEISNKELPQAVLSKINSDFRGYRIDDVKKIVEENKTTYKLELKSISKKWKVVFDSKGNILRKALD